MLHQTQPESKPKPQAKDDQLEYVSLEEIQKIDRLLLELLRIRCELVKPQRRYQQKGSR